MYNILIGTYFRDFKKIAKLKTREKKVIAKISEITRIFCQIVKSKSREIRLFHFREIKCPRK